MIGAEERKRDIKATIMENPTTITLKLKERSVIEGALSTLDKTMVLAVRIYLRNSGTQSIILSDKKGTYETSAKYGMLVDHTADLKGASEERVEFDSPYGRMKLTASYPQIVRDELCGYQCDLERIG